LHAARSPLYRQPICVLCIRYYYPLAPEELLLFRPEWLPAPPVLKRLLSFPSALTCASPLPSLKRGPAPAPPEVSRALAREVSTVGLVGAGGTCRWRMHCVPTSMPSRSCPCHCSRAHCSRLAGRVLLALSYSRSVQWWSGGSSRLSSQAAITPVERTHARAHARARAHFYTGTRTYTHEHIR
jgi:hypothetical protein